MQLEAKAFKMYAIIVIDLSLSVWDLPKVISLASYIQEWLQVFLEIFFSWVQANGWFVDKQILKIADMKEGGFQMNLLQVCHFFPSSTTYPSFFLHPLFPYY
jgi:hypothetical protein